MKTFIMHIIPGLTLLLFCNGLCQAHNGKTAYAIPVSGITIDGNLNDWPGYIELYPIDWVDLIYYNPRPPAGPDDFSATFRAGYNLKDNLLYVAVVVRDDDVVIHPDAPDIRNQDVCGIYIDADNSGGDNDIQGRQMYVMVPGKGKWTNGQDGNPSMNLGNTEISGIRGAFLRNGQTIIYEWSIPLFESFPDKRFTIQPGKTIGFDFLIADADGAENANFVVWSPLAGKSTNSDLFGELVFVESNAELSSVSGLITKDKSEDPAAGLILEVYREDQLITSVKTNSDGKYSIKLLRGDYSIRPKQGQNMYQPEFKFITLDPGQEIKNDINLVSVKIPRELEKAADIYKSLKGYQDSTFLEIQVLIPGNKMESAFSIFFAFDSPNRFIADLETGNGRFMSFSDGKKMTMYSGQLNQYIEEGAPQKVSIDDLERSLPPVYIQQVLLNEDPQKKLMEEIEEVKQTGIEKIGNIPVTVFELTKIAGSFAEGMVPRTKQDIPVSVRLWVGKKDFLIRKVEYELDMEQFASELSVQQQAEMKGVKYNITEKHTHIKVNPEFSEGFFTFVPPKDAKLVETFEDGSQQAVESQLIGKPAPDFTLKDIEGKDIKFVDFKGQVVIIDFWATWCGPCRIMIPGLITLQDQYASREFKIIGISTDRTSDIVASFAKENKINYLLLMADEKVTNDYGGILAIPTTFVIDKKGVVRYSYVGTTEISALQKLVEELLAE